MAMSATNKNSSILAVSKADTSTTNADTRSPLQAFICDRTTANATGGQSASKHQGFTEYMASVGGIGGSVHHGSKSNNSSAGGGKKSS